MIKCHKIKSEMQKLLEENVVSALQDINVWKNFLNRIPFVQKLWSTVYKWCLIKLKIFPTKETIKLRISSQSGRESLLTIYPTEENIQNAQSTHKTKNQEIKWPIWNLGHRYEQRVFQRITKTGQYVSCFSIAVIKQYY